jgi:hypothetical protein
MNLKYNLKISLHSFYYNKVVGKFEARGKAERIKML